MDNCGQLFVSMFSTSPGSPTTKARDLDLIFRVHTLRGWFPLRIIHWRDSNPRRCVSAPSRRWYTRLTTGPHEQGQLLPNPIRTTHKPSPNWYTTLQIWSLSLQLVLEAHRRQGRGRNTSNPGSLCSSVQLMICKHIMKSMPLSPVRLPQSPFRATDALFWSVLLSTLWNKIIRNSASAQSSMFLLHYCFTVLLFYCFTVLLFYCFTVLLFYCSFCYKLFTFWRKHVKKTRIQERKCPVLLALSDRIRRFLLMSMVLPHILIYKPDGSKQFENRLMGRRDT